MGKLVIIISAFLLAIVSPAWATDITELAFVDKADTLWVMISSLFILIFFIPGVSLFLGSKASQAGYSRYLSLGLCSMAITTLFWIVLGYSLVTTEGNFFYGDLSRVLLADMALNLHGNIPELLYVLYQISIASLAVTILSFALIDRVPFGVILGFIPMWLLLVYCPLCHIIWGPIGLIKGFNDLGLNFLAQDIPPFMDFAGGAVVFLSASISAIIINNELARHEVTAEIPEINSTSHYALVGAAMMWGSWWALTGGSTFSPDVIAVHATFNTYIAAFAGGLIWFIAEWLMHKQLNIYSMVYGMVIGMVAISSGAGFIATPYLIALSIITAVICYTIAELLCKHRYNLLTLYILIATSAFLGNIATGFLAQEAISGISGTLEGNKLQLMVQLSGSLLLICYVSTMSFSLIWTICQIRKFIGGSYAKTTPA